MNYLFFVGNKRCGTTLMVNLLNLHPDIFVSHESDIIWILNMMSRIKPGHYPWDGQLGMKITLKECAHIVYDWCLSLPVDKFRLVTEHLMAYGSEIQRQYAEKLGNISWMGDKKPVQCCDPEVRPFLLEHFPDARYLHMVRDPTACIASKMAATERAVAADDTRGLPSYWQWHMKRIVERWITHEEWALQVEKESSTYRLLLEDLCYSPVMIMKEVFHFLDLDMPEGVCDGVMKMVEPGPNTKYDGSDYDALRLTVRKFPGVDMLMKEYYG